jgi:hypothetical protein
VEHRETIWFDWRRCKMKFLVVEIETARPYAWLDHYAWAVGSERRLLHCAAGTGEKFVRFYFDTMDWDQVSASAWLIETFSHLYCSVLVVSEQEFEDTLALLTWHIDTPYGVCKDRWHFGWAPAQARN